MPSTLCRSQPVRIPLLRGLLLTGFLVAAACDLVHGQTSASGEPPPATAPGPKKAEKPKHPANRLAKETSPYLLLHAHNPVDWYPWGHEALAKAKRENKLIFLSIGYSSCYWCHVMERESFMDEEIAAFLNKHFVCIKVDREERPDIDDIYMTALRIYYQVIGSSRGGGWPLSMFLTPDGKPVAGGTYFPPRDRENMDGFLSILGRVEVLWREKRDGVEQSSNQLTEFVRQTLRQTGPPPELPGEAILTELQQALKEQFDPQHGGFNYSEQNPRQPKFPEASNLLFLIDRVRRGNDAEARTMLLTTLDKMGSGGIRDHLGGGFHRYSTDRYWRVPHFEKMLYDNAQLATVYAEAYALTDRQEYEQIARQTLDFIRRKLGHEQGGFYSAIDAETDGEEGRCYVWRKDELQQTLDVEELALLSQVYALSEPNFEDRFVLLRHQLTNELTEQQQSRLDEIRARLLRLRDQREAPLVDTKILTAWNGLAIRAFADGGRLLEDQRCLAMAQQTADFLLHRLRTPDGRLLRTYTAGQARLNAYLTDYAFLIDGLIALHQATGEARWLESAQALMDDQIKWYWDDLQGGFFHTSSDHEELIARSKDPVDAAIPAGNSVSVANLVYLAGKLNRPEYLERAEKTAPSGAAMFERAPASMPSMAIALAALFEARGKEAR
jgi:uncharacterized protein YyaL (SSP411 family)